MRYVLDSSVAFKWVVAEADSDRADVLRNEARAGIHDLIAPEFFPYELAHAITRAERQGRLYVGDGWPAWEAAMLDGPMIQPSMALLPRAFEISSRMRLGVYDCVYTALAEQEGCELITADSTLVRVLQPQFPFIRPLSTI